MGSLALQHTEEVGTIPLVRERVIRRFNEAGRVIVEARPSISDYENARRYMELVPHLLQVGWELFALGSPRRALGICADCARVLQQQGQYEAAAAVLERCLDKDLHEQDVGEVLNRLGFVRFQLGGLDLAERLLTDSLTVQESVYGADHIEVSPVLTNLGALHVRRGRWEEAKSALTRAITIKGAHGATALELADAQLHLAIVLAEADNPDLNGAAELLKQVQAVREITLGINHPDVAIALDNLAVVYRRWGKPSKGLEFVDRALAIKRKHFSDEEHPEIKTTLRIRQLIDDEVRSKDLNCG